MVKIRRTKLIDRAYNIRDTKLFIIATEGAETEKQYFGMFYDSRIHIEILPTTDNRSAPQYVLDRLEEFVNKYDLNQDDSLWLMFDVDRWPIKSLSQICREARKKKYHLAISNPCFESWLYLHFDDLSLYKEHIEEAVKRAINLDTNPQHDWPHTPGTRVYKIVDILLKITSIGDKKM